MRLRAWCMTAVPLQPLSRFILQVMKLVKGGGGPAQDAKLVLGGVWIQTQVSFPFGNYQQHDLSSALASISRCAG